MRVGVSERACLPAVCRVHEIDGYQFFVGKIFVLTASCDTLRSCDDRRRVLGRAAFCGSFRICFGYAELLQIVVL